MTLRPMLSSAPPVSEGDSGSLPGSSGLDAARRLPAGAMLQRANGEGHVAVERSEFGHRLATLRQAGAAKVLFPRNHVDDAFEAVLLNTAGGLAGGDWLRWQASAGRDAALRVTTQAAERVYRSNGADARVETRLRAEAGASLEWLPQETILFDGGRLSRSLEIELAEDARLLAVEAVVLGRRAFGERVRSGMLRDHIRVRQGGRLIHADAVRMEDFGGLVDRPATLGGAQAFATLLLAGPNRMPIDTLRSLLPDGDGIEAGASALPAITIVRILAAHGDVLRPALARLLTQLRGGPLPRVWQV
jgi:urease accessory protein